MWQGKVLFLCVAVPLLLTLLLAQWRHPTRRRLLQLSCTGAAGVGLTPTAIFVVPVIAAGCLASWARRAPRRAAMAFAATAAYPLAAGATTLALGGRNPDVYVAAEVTSRSLLELVLGTGTLALLAVAAVASAALLVPRPDAGRMVASTALLVAALLAPGVPLLIFDVTGLGQVLWRLVWAVPVAALIGVLVSVAAARIRQPALRALPAVAALAALALAGQGVWSSFEDVRVAGRPAWKLDPAVLSEARRVLGYARPSDTVLAPDEVSSTMLVISGTVTAVSPRWFFIRGLRDVPDGRFHLRWALSRFSGGLPAVNGVPALQRRPAAVRRALRLCSVDVACVPRRDGEARRLVSAAGYGRPLTTPSLTCLRRIRAPAR
jgi:hypothetical protein